MPCGITGKEVEKEKEKTKARAKAKRAKEEKETYNVIAVADMDIELPSAERIYDPCRIGTKATPKGDPRAKSMRNESPAQQLTKVIKEKAKERTTYQNNRILMLFKVAVYDADVGAIKLWIVEL